jgi:hypothetical protein
VRTAAERMAGTDLTIGEHCYVCYIRTEESVTRGTTTVSLNIMALSA